MNFFSSNKVYFYILGVVVFLLLFSCFFLIAPADFPAGTVFQIEKGDSLRSVSFKLKQNHIIRSRSAFEAFVIVFGREKHVVSSDYYFENKLSVFEIARRISKGEHHMAPIAVTIPEGFDNVQIADAFALKLLDFDRSKFLLEAKPIEGYLFPDTYFFLSTEDETDVIKSMSENFDKKIAPVLPDILKGGKTERAIIIMASLIEREGKGESDRGFISGILWKRISQNMPLQVDAALETYKSAGLPKSPIGNPGMQSILAALHPKNSPYLYYLHDKNGIIHYARTLSEHNQNINQYLR